MREFLRQLAPTLLAFALGITVALLLSHWAACEQDDSVCAFTGVPK